MIMNEYNKGMVGCFWVFAIVLFVVNIILGGSFRTDVVSYVANEKDTAKSDTTIQMDFTSNHFLMGLIKGKQPNIQWYITRIEEQNFKLKKLDIKTRHNVVNLLYTGITLTIYSPLEVTVNATFTKIKP
jgi:hypothetical protein